MPHGSLRGGRIECFLRCFLISERPSTGRKRLGISKRRWNIHTLIQRTCRLGSFDRQSRTKRRSSPTRISSRISKTKRVWRINRSRTRVATQLVPLPVILQGFRGLMRFNCCKHFIPGSADENSFIRPLIGAVPLLEEGSRPVPSADRSKACNQFWIHRSRTWSSRLSPPTIAQWIPVSDTVFGITERRGSNEGKDARAVSHHPLPRRSSGGLEFSATFDNS